MYDDMHTLCGVSPNKKRYTFFITSELETGLKALKGRDGIPEGEAVRRALAAYLEAEGMMKPKKAERGRAVTRRRS